MKLPVTIVPLLLLPPLLLLFPLGCGGPASAPGGTKGRVHCGSADLGDIQVTVHRADHGFFEAVGFGVSGADGQFELRDNMADGPLWLTPGKYRFTIESTGPTVMVWEKAFGDPSKTPLRRVWTEDDSVLDFDLPEPTHE